jgi:hypothetical protein
MVLEEKILMCPGERKNDMGTKIRPLVHNHDITTTYRAVHFRPEK